jgi:hypothetical protein
MHPPGGKTKCGEAGKAWMATGSYVTACVRSRQKKAETVHVHKRPFTHIEHLFGLFFAQSRARIGAAVARGMALRAMGCSESLVGVQVAT